MTPTVSVSPLSQVIEAAMMLSARGWRGLVVYGVVDAMHCACARGADCGKSAGKHPVEKGWTRSATADADALRNMFSYAARYHSALSLGLALGEQPSGEYLVAIDVDDEARLEALPSLPRDTLRCNSGRGYRLLYTVPAGTPVERLRSRSALGGERGIDAKVGGGQIVVHGLHQDGVSRYGWAAGHDGLVHLGAPGDGTVAELPAEWLEMLIEDVRPPNWVRPYTPQTIRSDGRMLRRAERYLEAAVVSDAARLARLPEGSRNDFLHKRACALLSLAQGLHLPARSGYVVRELAGAARAAGLGEHEIAQTVASAERWVSTSSAARYPVLREATNFAGNSAFGKTPENAENPQKIANERDQVPGVHVAVDDTCGVELLQYRGQAAAVARNVARLLVGHPVWRGGPQLDTYTDTVVWGGGVPEVVSRIARGSGAGGLGLVKADFSAVQAWCLEVGKLHVGVDAVEAGVRLAASERHTDTLVAWVRGLAPWDGRPRLGTWLPTYLGTPDDEYHRVTGRAWLIAAMQRALVPGLLVDVVPIMHGAQDAGKNRALATMFGEHVTILGRFDPDALSLKRMACSSLVLHDDEFRGRGPRHIDALKSWVSLTRETYMAKYENDLTVKPRRALLICSVNVGQFLYDETGNRRFWPWAVAQMRDVAFGALERDAGQVVAEALAAVDSGASWRDGLEALRTAARDVVDDRQVVDPLQEQLLGLIEAGTWSKPVTSAELLHMLGIRLERDEARSMATRLGLAVDAVKGTTGRKDIGSTKVRWYAPPNLPK